MAVLVSSEMGHLRGKRIWGVPRGGSIVAGLATQLVGAIEATGPDDAEVIVDDLIDSGATMRHWEAMGKRFCALLDKRGNSVRHWIEFPWEESGEKDIQDSVRRILEYIGDDPSRDGLQETPDRIVRSWSEIFSGYQEEDANILKWFESDSTGMVVLRGIEFASMCEHHFLPFFGTADVAYIPDGRVIGISKLARLVNAKSRKLQIQERLTQEVGQALEAGGVQGVAVVVRSQHMCMLMRGVGQTQSVMTTSYYGGRLQGDKALQEEFLRGVK